MLRKAFLSCVALSVCTSLAMSGAASPRPPVDLTAEQIVEKHVSAKGGLQAWRAVPPASILPEKDRPYLGQRDVEPYSLEELKSASFESDLDGPLVDYATKGNKVELEGVEKVENHDAYKLKLTMKGGGAAHLG